MSEIQQYLPPPPPAAPHHTPSAGSTVTPSRSPAPQAQTGPNLPSLSQQDHASERSSLPDHPSERPSSIQQDSSMHSNSNIPRVQSSNSPSSTSATPAPSSSSLKQEPLDFHPDSTHNSHNSHQPEPSNKSENHHEPLPNHDLPIQKHEPSQSLHNHHDPATHHSKQHQHQQTFQVTAPPLNTNPTHPNAKATSHVNNGTITSRTNITTPICRNCKTQNTPLWRRDETGQVLCNACGLFLKLHGRPRPISLKTDTIKSRNRIKQPNPTKNSGANTPELKVKDSKLSPSGGASGASGAASSGISTPSSGPTVPGKKSPKSSKKNKSSHSTPNSTSGDSTTNQNSANHSSLTPLLPATLNNHSTVTGVKVNPGSNYSSHLGPYHQHHLPNHLNHQVQPLHYPSSTPTQFAPGLQRITSPLLLSTTSSLSNARSSSNVGDKSNGLTAAQAAGALETMSNELGPSATFKSNATDSKNHAADPSATSTTTANGVSLINSNPTTIKKEPGQSTPSLLYSTPSSALHASSAHHAGSSLPPPHHHHNHPPPPKLPALGSATTSSISSPSFGPQFHLNANSSAATTAAASSSPATTQNSTTEARSATPLGDRANSPNSTGVTSSSKPSLPPINHVASRVGSTTPLPHFQNSFSNLSNTNTFGGASSNSHSSGPYGNNDSFQSSQQHPSSSQQPSEQKKFTSGGNQDSFNTDTNSNDNNNNNNNNNYNHHETTLLKTRISELELVNDLYRTRIMELEAMEQAARLRETSMRKRLDEVLQLQEQDQRLAFEDGLNKRPFPGVRANTRVGSSEADGASPFKKARVD